MLFKDLPVGTIFHYRFTGCGCRICTPTGEVKQYDILNKKTKDRYVYWHGDRCFTNVVKVNPDGTEIYESPSFLYDDDEVFLD